MAPLPTRYLLVGMKVVGVVLAEDTSDLTERKLVIQPDEPLLPEALVGLSADLWDYSIYPDGFKGMSETLHTAPLGTVSGAHVVGLEDTAFKNLPVSLPLGAEVLSLMFGGRVS